MSLPIVLAITKKAATPHKAAPARKLNDLHKNDRKSFSLHIKHYEERSFSFTQ